MFGIGKWKTEEWQGEVVKKEEFGKNSDTSFYYLHVKFADGKVERKKYYDQRLYESFNVGDKIIKRPGEKKPAKN